MKLKEFLNKIADISLGIIGSQSGITIKLKNRNFDNLEYKQSLSLESTQDDVLNAVERVVSDFIGDVAELYQEPVKDKREPLTKAQRNFYNKISKFIKSKGYTPSLSEMCSLCGYSSRNSAFRMIKRLTKKGWLSLVNNMVVLNK